MRERSHSRARALVVVAMRIGRTLGKFFGRKQDIAPSPAARALAEYLSGVEGSSLAWCSCGALLAPIVFGDGEQAEVIALGCIHGHGAVPIRVGVLIEGERRRPTAH